MAYSTQRHDVCKPMMKKSYRESGIISVYGVCVCLVKQYFVNPRVKFMSCRGSECMWIVIVHAHNNGKDGTALSIYKRENVELPSVADVIRYADCSKMRIAAILPRYELVHMIKEYFCRVRDRG